MTCGKGVDCFISLHSDSTNLSSSVCFYNSDGSIREPSPTCPTTVSYLGLTSTQLPDRVVGWGPGAIFDLLDGELRLLTQGTDPLDVRTCMVTDNPIEVATTGLGNVCLWCLTHMVCQVKIVEGLEKQMFTQLALSPRSSKYGHRAFVVCGNTVTSVDLKKGNKLARENLHLRDIVGIAYCSQMDFLVTASKDLTIRVWGPDLELKVALVGHSALVTSLLCCPHTGHLLSCSLDGTLRCWCLEECDQMQKITVEGSHPPLAVGGPDKRGTFFTFSNAGVDFWTINSLYHPHCKLGGDLCGPVRQMVISPFPPPYPTRVLCVHGDHDVTLVSAGTGAILTGLTVGSKVLCADYCLPKETILILTEDGVMLTASALTHPITVLDEWSGDGQKAYQWGKGDQDSGPGPACYMVLYSSMPDRKTAMAEWKSLQEQRGQQAKKQKYVNEPKNRSLVMLGHCGGYLTVLKLHTKSVQYMTPAHKGQDITAMQAYPENNYLLTTGKDKSVLVWRVFLYAEECLSLHMSVFCGQPPLHLALMGPLLAITFQEPENATYSLAYYHMDNRRRLDHPPKQDHLGCITGLSVNLQLKVCASCSEDGTIRIWDEDNQLIRTLELLTEPECLAFVGQNEYLLVGIRGDLHYINISQILPQDLPLQPHYYEKVDPFPDLPIPCKSSGPAKVYVLHKLSFSLLQELVALQVRNRDLEALQQGELEIKRKTKKRPRALRQRIKKEAFDRYMKLVYKEPVKIVIPEVDTFDLNHIMFPPKPHEERPVTPPIFREGFFPNHSEAQKPTSKKDKSDQERSISSHAPHRNMGFIPNSVLVGQLWPNVVVQTVPPPSPEEGKELKLWDWDSSSETMFLEFEEPGEEESKKELFLDSPEPEIKIASPPKPPPPEVVVEKDTTTKKPKMTPKTLPPVKDIKPLPRRIKPTTPPRVRTPSPTIPEFLVQFLEEDWFKRIFPDKKSIPASLQPEDFVRQLLELMKTAEPAIKMSLMTALLTLCKQGVLANSGLVFKGLVACLSQSITPNMSAAAQRFAHELLNMLVCLCPEDSAFMVELLVLMAYTQLDFQKTVLSQLQKMGLKEDVTKLTVELNSWQNQEDIQDQLAIWESLRKKATYWLSQWTSKYMVQNRALALLKGASPVDVLNYFCSLPEIAKSESEVEQPVIHPEKKKDAVLMPALPPTSKPIYRLGETYTMSRTREPRGIVLPPLTYRPLLLGFTRFLKLPMTQVFLDPFPFALDPHCLKPSPRRFFMVEQSYVSYYR
ncbi:hypothetical protein ACEWY4_018908 [Coilia grayii]|uniref:WD repeat-containing protein 97 n=1 Tax=Coilia grayii TaxID=363190 RepID=A0ABD1JEJ1_9TELE